MLITTPSIKRTAHLCVFLFSTGLLSAQTKGNTSSDNKLTTRIDRIIDSLAGNYLAQPNTFDLAVGIVIHGKSYEYNYHKGSGILRDGNSFYGIGSVAKTFVGWMLANAVIEGKMKLTDDIRKYLPQPYPNLAYKGIPIQVQHLANHTSALPELSQVYSDSYLDSVAKLPPQGLQYFYNSYTSDSLLADMHHFSLDTVPGTKYRYNGNAMMVLITLLQQVYRENYPELITRYLSAKYHMSDTKPALGRDDRMRMLTGHDDQGNELPLVIDEGFRGAPTMLSTPNNMLLFLKANLNNADAVVHLTQQPTYSDTGITLGLSWMMGSTNNVPYIMHTGRDGFGFSSLIYIYPSLKAGVVLMVNETTAEAGLSKLKDDIYTTIFEKK